MGHVGSVMFMFGGSEQCFIVVVEKELEVL